MATIHIDNKALEINAGETILQVARRNDIYIPTMCYITKLEPISSCRMCSVKVEGIDGFVLSCQEKAIDGLKITTNSHELNQFRQSIMKLYCVNHPLECGVCDKSGECDLQNKTLEFGVAEQSFSAKEQKRRLKKWGILGYDPYLCIMCERCAHVCNEIVGTSALYVKPGGYKSEIDMHFDRCIQCGECVSVCPVGAMISNDYKYTSNAWECESIPATCSHCSSGCSLYYDVKHTSIDDAKPEIKRVVNDYEFSNLCGAGRFGFDFANECKEKDKEAFSRAIAAFKEADTISFSSYITNEEALILQKLKDKFGYRLVNQDANSYKNFMRVYEEITGKSLYDGDLKSIKSSDFIITFGSSIAHDNPMVRFAVSEASRKQRAKVIYMHPVEDFGLRDIVSKHIKYEVGSEEGVISMLSSAILAQKDISSKLKDYFDDLDYGYISAESNVGEEEFEEILRGARYKKCISLVVGEDIYNHPRSENIAVLLGYISKYSDFSITVIPPKTNTLGVSLICDLDEIKGSKVIGYNAKGDFVLSSLGDGDLDMPALNQQEGTFTTIDKRVVPTNVALPYGGYTLNDIANALLDINVKNTIDYTPYLPQDKGYKSIKFDDLTNNFDNSGNDCRGYLLNSHEISSKEIVPKQIEELKSFDGLVIYKCNPLDQFSEFTKDCHNIRQTPMLVVSEQFARVAKVKDGIVKIDSDDLNLEIKLKIDRHMKGTIALLPTFMSDLKDDKLYSSYRYSISKIEQVG